MTFLHRSSQWNVDIDRYINRIVPPSPLHKLPTPVSRFLGYRKEQKPDVGNVMGAVWSFVGAFCGLAVVAAVFNNTESIQKHMPPALIASFVGEIYVWVGMVAGMGVDPYLPFIPTLLHVAGARCMINFLQKIL